MIFVMLGTNPYPFIRLIDKVVEWAEKVGEHVIVQSGNTPVPAEAIEAYPFMTHSKITQLMLQADVVITQGGFGSLQDCITLGVKTVAVPRLIEKGESQDDQKEIVSALAEEGLVVPLYEVENLDAAINEARKIEVNSVKTFELPNHVATTVNKVLGN